jgi:thiopurine S-methyltransferase
VEAFFLEHHLQPSMTSVAGFQCWRAGAYEIYCGDIFDLGELDNSDIDAVYDRASLIALNPVQRRQYARMLIDLLPQKSRMLLVAMDYPQDEMQGPPYSVEETEVKALFSPDFSVELLHTLDLLKDTERYGGKGVSRMLEQVYLLKR